MCFLGAITLLSHSNYRWITHRIHLLIGGFPRRLFLQNSGITGVIPLKVRAITTEMKGDILVIALILCGCGNNFLCGKLSPSKSKNVIFLPNIAPKPKISIPFFFYNTKSYTFSIFLNNKKSDTFPIFFIFNLIFAFSNCRTFFSANIT